MKKILFPFAITSAIFAGAMAFADDAANAYVSVKGPKVKTTGGVDFAVDSNSDSVTVSVEAQPGWVLTSPAVQNIPKGQAGQWKAKSFYGESDAGGEICIPTETITTNHISAPHFSVTLNYSCVPVGEKGNNGTQGNIGVGQGNEHVGEGNNGNGKGIPGNEPEHNKKDRDAKLSFTAAAADEKGGHHKVVIIRETCPGGKSNKKTRDNKDITTTPDDYAWSWSCGPHSGTGKGKSLVVGPLDLPAGKYELSVTLTAKCSECGQCVYSKTSKKNLNVK